MRSTAGNGPPQLGSHALVGDLGLLSMVDGVKDLNDSQTCCTHLNDLNTNPNLKWSWNNSKEQHKLIQDGVGGPPGTALPILCFSVSYPRFLKRKFVAANDSARVQGSLEAKESGIHACARRSVFDPPLRALEVRGNPDEPKDPNVDKWSSDALCRASNTQKGISSHQMEGKEGCFPTLSKLGRSLLHTPSPPPHPRESSHSLTGDHVEMLTLLSLSKLELTYSFN